MGEHEAGLGHTDALDGLETGGGEAKCAVAGEADVLGGKNHHATSDKLGVFAGLHHAGEIVEGGVGVAAAHGFDEGANGIVVIVAFFVIAGEFAAGSFDDGVSSDVLGERHGEFEVA